MSEYEQGANRDGAPDWDARQPSTRPAEPRTAAGRLRAAVNAAPDDKATYALLPVLVDEALAEAFMDGARASRANRAAIEAEAAAPVGSLDVATWTFRDPDGSGFCTRCLLPIAVHPLDEHGEDVDRCPDQPARLLRGKRDE